QAWLPQLAHRTYCDDRNVRVGTHHSFFHSDFSAPPNLVEHEWSNEAYARFLEAWPMGFCKWSHLYHERPNLLLDARDVQRPGRRRGLSSVLEHSQRGKPDFFRSLQHNSNDGCGGLSRRRLAEIMASGYDLYHHRDVPNFVIRASRDVHAPHRACSILWGQFSLREFVSHTSNYCLCRSREFRNGYGRY